MSNTTIDERLTRLETSLYRLLNTALPPASPSMSASGTAAVDGNPEPTSETIVTATNS